MTWVINNIWQIVGFVSAFIGNIVALAVGWTKLNEKVETNTLDIQEINKSLIGLKDEFKRDQRQLTKELNELKESQHQILIDLKGINTKLEFLIEKK